MKVILGKFQSNRRISYHFIAEYGGPALENWVKNVNSSAGSSLNFICKQENLRWDQKALRFCNSEIAHKCLGQWFTNEIRCLKMEGMIFWALAAIPCNTSLNVS